MYFNFNYNLKSYFLKRCLARIGPPTRIFETMKKLQRRDQKDILTQVEKKSFFLLNKVRFEKNCLSNPMSFDPPSLNFEILRNRALPPRLLDLQKVYLKLFFYKNYTIKCYERLSPLTISIEDNECKTTYKSLSIEKLFIIS
jgi:hypothetical protein